MKTNLNIWARILGLMAAVVGGLTAVVVFVSGFTRSTATVVVALHDPAISLADDRHGHALSTHVHVTPSVDVVALLTSEATSGVQPRAQLGRVWAGIAALVRLLSVRAAEQLPCDGPGLVDRTLFPLRSC